jgi:hypothetical protein
MPMHTRGSPALADRKVAVSRLTLRTRRDLDGEGEIKYLDIRDKNIALGESGRANAEGTRA